VKEARRLLRTLVENDQPAPEGLVPEVTEPWPAELGVPINQDDLAGTLMAFVWGTLDMPPSPS
jgi:hypothetical protein